MAREGEVGSCLKLPSGLLGDEGFESYQGKCPYHKYGKKSDCPAGNVCKALTKHPYLNDGLEGLSFMGWCSASQDPPLIKAFALKKECDFKQKKAENVVRLVR